MPTLVMHGSNDYRIPVEVAQKFHAATPERWLVEGAPHRHPESYTAQWSAALKRFQAIAVSATRRLRQRLRFAVNPAVQHFAGSLCRCDTFAGDGMGVHVAGFTIRVPAVRQARRPALEPEPSGSSMQESVMRPGIARSSR